MKAKNIFTFTFFLLDFNILDFFIFFLERERAGKGAFNDMVTYYCNHSSTSIIIKLMIRI